MIYTNSTLVDYTKLSPNCGNDYRGKNEPSRVYPITRITPHCVVGQCSVETLGAIFYSESRQASSNYGIGEDGRVGMYCEEKDRSWCSSSYDNDNRAITIECASDNYSPYAFNDIVYNKLIDLCVDICKRNGKTKLLWFGDKDKTLSYEPKSDEMVLTAHRWFSSTSCPGDWFYSREGDLAEKVTTALNTTAPRTWYQDDVDFLVSKGITNGENITDDCTRAMAATMIWRLAGCPSLYLKNNNKYFSDVENSKWYTDAISWCANVGIMTGYDNGKFGPNDYLTREQLITVLARYNENILGNNNVMQSDVSNYVDFNLVHTYSDYAFRWAINYKIVGVNTENLRPRDPITRYELCAILSRFIQNIC